MRPTHPAGVVDMRKAPFHYLAPPTQELLASLASNAPPIGIHGGLLAHFSLPGAFAVGLLVGTDLSDVSHGFLRILLGLPSKTFQGRGHIWYW